MREKGVTLIEVLIAVTLLSILSVGMFLAMRIGLNAYSKADDRMMDNRRAAGAQRILQEEMEGLVPVIATCGAGAGGGGALTKTVFFQGEPEVMRLVSTFSLQQGWRGQPQVLELFVIPGEREGVRLVVNEILYTGPSGAGRFCTGARQFLAVNSGPQSFVLADKLAYCRFSFLAPAKDPNAPPIWVQTWNTQTWPLAVRVEMAPLAADASRVQPISVTAPIYLHRSPDIPYADLSY
jgi:general secretion pathway protein J